MSRIQSLERQALKAVVALYRADLEYQNADIDNGLSWRRRWRRIQAVIRAGRALDDARADKRRKERAACEACRGHVALGKTCYACGRAGERVR